jgi:hypothetical protein
MGSYVLKNSTMGFRLLRRAIYRHRGQNEVERATYCIGRLSKFSEVILSFKKYPCLGRAESR